MPRGVYERKPSPPKAKPVIWCHVDGCDRIANRRGMRLCERHYYRQRAHGSFKNPRTRRDFYTDKHGYRRVVAIGHPAASKDGSALEHRVVFYDAHGAGPFACHWCGIEIEWGRMEVDHINFSPSDNSLDNLVASCGPCNRARSQPHSKATLRERYATTLTCAGETRPIVEWAERLGIAKNSLLWRLDRGWPLERALTQGRGKFGPRASR